MFSHAERDFWDSDVTLYQAVDRDRAEEALASQIQILSASRSEIQYGLCKLTLLRSRHLTGTVLGYRNIQIFWLSQELVNFQKEWQVIGLCAGVVEMLTCQEIA